MIQPKSSSRPILIVDDEEIVLVALRDTLLREGYTVISSPHAVHALSVLQEHQFALVISDQQMPMVTGLEFLAQVKQIQPDATRILITAVLNIGTLIEAINKAEIFRFLVKPWSRDELLASVKTAMDRHEKISRTGRQLETAIAENRRLEDRHQQDAEEIQRLRQALEQQTAPK